MGLLRRTRSCGSRDIIHTKVWFPGPPKDCRKSLQILYSAIGDFVRFLPMWIFWLALSIQPHSIKISPKSFQPRLQIVTMAITILAPAPAAIPYHNDDSSDDSDEDGGVDLQGDVGMRPAKRARHSKEIVTPGETVTDDPQWMRCV